MLVSSNSITLVFLKHRPGFESCKLKQSALKELYTYVVLSYSNQISYSLVNF